MHAGVCLAQKKCIVRLKFLELLANSLVHPQFDRHTAKTMKQFLLLFYNITNFSVKTSFV